MAWIFKAMAVFLALLWLPMVSHCDLKHLPWLEFLACSDQADTAPRQDNDCQTAICASVESGHYKLEELDGSALVPVLVAAIPNPLPGAAPEKPFAITVAASFVPIELRQSWRFILRAASLPRSPSFIS